MSNEINFPSYYAVIPANVRYDKRLKANEKLLYGEITCLCQKEGYCWSTNKHFADLYSVSNTSISKWISSLVEIGYVNLKLIYKEGSKEIDKRYLSIVQYPIEEKLNTPIEEKLKGNNTSTINNTSITKNKTETSEKEDFREIEIEVIEPEDLSKQVKDLQKENSKKVALKKVKEWDQDVLNCTQAITKLFPDHLKPATINQTQKWIDTIDKLKRIEQIPLKRVYEIVKSVREDDFWSKNFLSLAKLRKKNGDDVMYIVVFNEKFPNAPDKAQSKIDQQFRDLLANSNPNDLM